MEFNKFILLVLNRQNIPNEMIRLIFEFAKEYSDKDLIDYYKKKLNIPMNWININYQKEIFKRIYSLKGISRITNINDLKVGDIIQNLKKRSYCRFMIVKHNSLYKKSLEVKQIDSCNGPYLVGLFGGEYIKESLSKKKILSSTLTKYCIKIDREYFTSCYDYERTLYNKIIDTFEFDLPKYKI